jgi:hypothetical protein
MRDQRIFFGLDYDFIEDEIAHLKGKARYMRAARPASQGSEKHLIAVPSEDT